MSFSNGQGGFVIYLDLNVIFNKPMTLELHESLLFTNGRQWARDFNYTGYGFEKETVEPGKPRKIGWIWINEKWPIKELIKEDNYMTVTFKDPQAAPETMIFITTIETDPNAFDGVASTLKNEKCVVTLCQISGDSAMHAVCMADSVEEMRAFAKRIRNTCPGLKKFHACNVWETMKGSVLSE